MVLVNHNYWLIISHTFLNGDVLCITASEIVYDSRNVFVTQESFVFEISYLDIDFTDCESTLRSSVFETGKKIFRNRSYALNIFMVCKVAAIFKLFGWFLYTPMRSTNI